MSAPRKFDWDEARRLRADGWTYRAIAEHCGVCISAVELAVNDAYRARAYAYGAERSRRVHYWIGECVHCGGPASRPPWGTGRCRACAAIAATMTVRPEELLCMSCDQWKPDESFTPQASATARRGRHGECKACAATRRREQRARARSAA